jgi:hypothetical protein
VLGGCTVAELLGRISSAELGEWMHYFHDQDEAWARAHPELAAAKGPTTRDGRPLNMRGTGMG